MKRKDDTLFEIFVIGGMEGKIFTRLWSLITSHFKFFTIEQAKQKLCQVP